MLSIWKKLEYFDQALCLRINRDGSNAFFDSFMPVIREANIWAPLYLFLLVFVIYNFGWRGVLWCMSMITAVALSDMISSQVMKDGFGRLRPCNDPFMQQYLRFIVQRCPSSFSFTSSHAANHFTMAAFIWFTGKETIGKWLQLIFAWAFAISYAQVYVGVHYPLDVLAGAIVGLLLGALAAWIFNKMLPGGLPADRPIATFSLPN